MLRDMIVITYLSRIADLEEAGSAVENWVMGQPRLQAD